jgi:carbon storage regulator
MLVLSRKVGERILVGDQVTITVVRITGGGVRIGIEAPPELAVIREELKDGTRDAGCAPVSSGGTPSKAARK